MFMGRAEFVQIFLVGGTSKLPGIASRLTDYLFAPKSNLTISAGVDPDEAIAKGSVLQGQRLLSNGNAADFQRDDVRRTSALSKPLGLKTSGAVGLTVLLDAPAPLPNRRMVELIVPASTNGKSSVLLSLYEGESTVKVSKPERKTNGHAKADDDDDDDEDEEEEVRTLVVEPRRHIVDLIAPIASSSQKSVLKLTITVDAAGKGTLESRSGSKTATASFGV